MIKPIKISDTAQDVAVGSRADIYWTENPYKPYYNELRPKLVLPKYLSKGNNIKHIYKIG